MTMMTEAALTVEETSRVLLRMLLAMGLSREGESPLLTKVKTLMTLDRKQERKLHLNLRSHLRKEMMCLDRSPIIRHLLNLTRVTTEGRLSMTMKRSHSTFLTINLETGETQTRRILSRCSTISKKRTTKMKRNVMALAAN